MLAQSLIARRTLSAPPAAVIPPARAPSAAHPPVTRPPSPQADVLAATLARAVKGREAARAPDGLTRPRAPMLMRAGDPKGMMKEHPAKGPTTQRKAGDDPPDWTYHHIIPENVIEAFWNKAKPEIHKLQPLEVGKQGALTSLVRRGYRQLRQAAVYTLTQRLKAELYDQPLSQDQFVRLAQQAIAGLLPDSGAPITYRQAADQILDNSGASARITHKPSLDSLRNDIEGHLGKAVAASRGGESQALYTESYVTGKLGLRQSDVGAEDVTEQMLRWMPGNIHHGPTSKLRRNPAGRGFDPERDDGGDTFEVAARHLISQQHYATLKALHKAMVDYTDAPTDELLQRVGELLVDLTAYSVTEWSQVKHLWVEGPDGFWRIRPRLKVVGGEFEPGARPRKSRQAVHTVFTSLRTKTPATVAGVYSDYPHWTVTTAKNRTVRLDDWDMVIGPLYQGAFNMSDAEAVLDDLFIATGGHERS